MPDARVSRPLVGMANLRRVLALLLTGLALLFASGAAAHFLLNLNVRVLHVDHLRDGLRVYLRTPMPYLVADKLGPVVGDDLPEPAPFTTNALEDGQLVHYVAPDALERDHLGLGRLAEDGYVLARDGQRLRGTVEALSVHRVGDEPGFATLEEARSAMETPVRPDTNARPLYVGDAIVDIVIFYRTDSAVSAYSVQSLLNPGLPGQETTANLIIDYGPGTPMVFRSRGLLETPVEISRSAVSAMATFVWEGVRHILEGIDHVLFVICLVIGAHTLHSLLWRVTGFSVGHSVTLALGFFGYVPSGAWFIPAVETGIALSIIYAAVVAILPGDPSAGRERQTFFVTLAIGLLHGLGFSFVLQEILQVSSPNIWQSLLAFNVGVEIGQVAIVLAIWPLLHVTRAWRPVLWRRARIAISVACIAVAGFWSFDRGRSVFTALTLLNARNEDTAISALSILSEAAYRESSPISDTDARSHT